MASYYLEDFEPGLQVATQDVEITQADVDAYEAVTADLLPASEEGSHRTRAHDLVALAMATGLSARCGHLAETALAFLGIEHWEFHHPIYVGDRIALHWQVIERRPTRAGNAGVIKRHMALWNQAGQRVQSGTFATLVRARQVALVVDRPSSTESAL